MTSQVVQVETSTSEITALLEERLLPAIGGQRLDVAMAAMLMAIVCSMRPDIPQDDLLNVIQAASSFITTQVALVGDQTVN